jgi:hypothetical protein
MAMEQQKKLQWLRGGLVLVGLNVLLSPTLLFSRLYFEYTEVLSTETWLLLSTAGSPLYHQKFTAFIFAQVALNTCLFLFSICIVQQFFAKKKTFPEHYFIMLLLLLVLFMLDILAALLIFPNLLSLTLKSLYFTLWGMLSAAFFLPYIRYSGRVKNTFVC